ncbi:MAG: hypothetical protein HOA15_04835 [Candidatus Marinimicrobia bacterium]|jgi:hypothetical protein|nr:hypothetical protein [Candidatus Neomarinimicrobiota bacterium]MBT3675687.1 hypothetical protein [Candidatus Neomarinimicrobiota bacterium]MBT3763727.1 hypothetical protein [Candidatus Neomarinimicrobiota bacterium]MBT4068355.1 hypothetical protein [Candidatus Neomarinimicrobiota bacterium]MBT4271062.1 hypothetical protein [Candidatus Neomarinimicrobiota bacterium]
MEVSKKTKAALWWHRLRKKNNYGTDTFSLSPNGRGVYRFLIILPEHTTQSELAKRFVFSMRNALGPKDINKVQILGPAHVGNLLNLEDFRDFILYTEADLNRWGLPGKKLNWACQRIQADAVLDLNQDFAPVSATICSEVNAPLKVGFYSEEGEDYFNVMIRRHGSDLMESGFKEIFQIMGIR